MSSDPLTEDTKEGNVPKLHHDRTKQTLRYYLISFLFVLTTLILWKGNDSQTTVQLMEALSIEMGAGSKSHGSFCLFTANLI
jgi:hypothetical protein